jgi:hypothetical protein
MSKDFARSAACKRFKAERRSGIRPHLGMCVASCGTGMLRNVVLVGSGPCDIAKDKEIEETLSQCVRLELGWVRNRWFTLVTQCDKPPKETALVTVQVVQH